MDASPLINQSLLEEIWSILTRLKSRMKLLATSPWITSISLISTRMRDTIDVVDALGAAIRGQRLTNVKSKAIIPSTDPKMTDMVSWTLSGTYDIDKPVLIDAHNPQRFITKRKAVQLISQLAGCFEQDSTVCLHLGNDVLYPILTMAIYASRCRWTGTNTAYTSVELEHHFRNSMSKYVVTTADNLETVHEAARRCGTNPEIVLFTDILGERPEMISPAGETEINRSLRTLHDLLHDGSEASLRRALESIDINSTAAIFSTSGTTGLPKMAARSHKALVQETKAIEDNNSSKDYEVRRLWCTPIFHAFSTPEMICNALRLGQVTYFMKRFSDRLFPEYVHKYRITEASAPPPMLLRLVNNESSHSQIQSLRTVFSGGAPLPPALAQQFIALFATPPRIAQVWGMTEGGWFATFKYPEQDITGAVGRAVPGYKIRLGKEGRTELKDGTLAYEVQVKGPSLMSGYLGNEEASREAFDDDGWLKTGDIGYFRDGKVFLVDRMKDLIKYNCWQVAPAEFEDALLNNSDVRDAGVIGVGHGVEEHPLAFVVRRTGALTSQMVKEHLLTRLASYKFSHCEVRFIDSIPKSASGKILRRELRELVNADTGDRFS